MFNAVVCEHCGQDHYSLTDFCQVDTYENSRVVHCGSCGWDMSVSLDWATCRKCGCPGPFVQGTDTCDVCHDPNENSVVVTRHPALVEYLWEIGLISRHTPVIAHAKAEDVKGKHVFGVLPMSLACHALSVTEVPLALTPEDRGKELPIERMREIAGQWQTYHVKQL